VITPTEWGQEEFRWDFQLGLMSVEPKESKAFRRNNYSLLAKEKDVYETYEEALEAGLLEGLKLIEKI